MATLTTGLRSPGIDVAFIHPLTTRGVLLTVCFVLFLYPVSINGIGVNYSFSLLPLFYLVIEQKVKRPPNAFMFLMVLYTMIFVIASIYQIQFYGEALRRIISFLLFMSMFTYMFVRIDEVMIASFKMAVVSISLLLSLWSAYLFFIVDAASLGVDVKDAVGSQRIGFIFLLGFWLVYLHEASTKGWVLLKYGALLALLIGILLTFSRSSIVGLLVSVALFVIAGCMKWLRRPNLHTAWISLGGLVGISLLLILLATLVPVTFSFFETRLFNHLMDSGVVSEDLANPSSSGGTRLVLWQTVLSFVMNHPLTGAGYLGVWSVTGDYSGSAHSQYADVLFRTGVIGFLAYLWLLSVVLRYLFFKERALFWGLVAMLAYGVFHETFKEPHGGFVLAFLVGMLPRVFRERAASARNNLGNDERRIGKIR